LFDEDEGVLKRCLECNENGLIRCPDCCSWSNLDAHNWFGANFYCLVAVCNQCKGWIQNTHWIHWHFSFCSIVSTSV
jgi:hypothetical protein